MVSVRVINVINLSSETWRELIDYYGLNDYDLKTLYDNMDFFEKYADEIVHEFYDEVMKRGHLKGIINENSTVERLKKTQVWYLKTLATDVIDDDYIAGREKVGAVHAKIGLSATWYIGGYSIYLRCIRKRLSHSDPHVSFSIYEAVTKRILFDSAIILEQYIGDVMSKNEAYIKHMTNASNELIQSVDQVTAIASDFANSATVLAEAQGAVVESASTLYDKSTAIDAMSKLVIEIAAQTHMLGLNASIEATRAGDRGQGFTVIANEIRKLAERTKKSSEEINTSVSELVKYINSINQQAEQTMATSEQQAASAQELSALIHGIEDIATRLKQ
ncbi:globin-coupled sensor protein [Alicyclobacillus dauci]|uniref:Globin-coupled sensor protein n=1 Tax=Alicyclobacillus dauci TaxID=1475485 RepID=A0ABY6Z9K7_9BACL|nr:globin-coupled sensor protein [Alicyclobacillus dauci]WAH39484.1 globin-coupled sensor protein [Alicyclobacillus dauci]WAH39544.1 globin-coupled sensor protein [Alicyclobacillus dauci]